MVDQRRAIDHFLKPAQNPGITHTVTTLTKGTHKTAKQSFSDSLFFKKYFIFLFFSLQSDPIKQVEMKGDCN